jgi:DNA-directed RNA polymerase sigma subunit (sigma70/sigma32)
MTADFPYAQVELNLTLCELKPLVRERDFYVLCGWLEGKTFQELGDEMKISGNRAMQIYRRMIVRVQVKLKEQQWMRSLRQKGLV